MSLITSGELAIPKCCFYFEAGGTGGVGDKLFRIAFLAGAETGTDKLLLPTCDHLSQNISERDSTVIAGRIVAVDMLPHGFLVKNAKLKRLCVLSVFFHKNPQPIDLVHGPIDSHQISSDRTLLGRHLRKAHIGIIASMPKRNKIPTV
jgi:hypothetical protein